MPILSWAHSAFWSRDTVASTVVVGTGSATYGGPSRKKAYTPLPMSANGRTIVTKFIYVGTGRMKLYTYAYGIVPESSPRQFSE